MLENNKEELWNKDTDELVEMIINRNLLINTLNDRIDAEERNFDCIHKINTLLSKRIDNFNDSGFFGKLKYLFKDI